jgi:hypothetical protein
MTTDDLEAVVKQADTATDQKGVFDLETTRAMALAFDKTCDALGLQSEADPGMVRSIADKIIDFAEHGERDPDALCDLTVRALRRAAKS